MSLNHREIDLIVEELNIEGCFIQKIIQSSWDVLCLCLYGKGGATELLICLTASAVRLHRTKRAIPKSEKPLRFCEFLRSRIKGGMIQEVQQLGSDRIVRFTISRGDFRYYLYARLWSNAANIILTDTEGLILDALRRSPRRGEISGGSYRPEESIGLPAKSKREFAIRELPGEGSFNERIDNYYAKLAQEVGIDALREEVQKTWAARRVRLLAAIDNLKHKHNAFQQCETIKTEADLILSGLDNAEILGNWVELDDYRSGGRIRLQIDGTKTLVENANLRYERYRKEKRAILDLEADIANSEAELQELNSQEAELLSIDNPLVLQKALKQGRQTNSSMRPERASRAKRARPGLSFESGAWSIYLGRNNRENDELLRRHVRGNDLWLHVREYSGSYVFIKSKAGKTVPLEVLLDAGNLALFYSKARNNGQADLFYTQVKYLRRAKTGTLGLVIPTQEKNLHIKLDESRINRLKNT